MARRLTALQLPKVTAPTLPKLGKKKAAAAEITVQATKLSLSLAADAAPPKSVLLEVDMPGDADEPLRSKAAAVSKGSATLGFKHAFAAGAGSSLHAALAERGVPLASNQVQFSLLSRQPLESGLFDVCAELGVVPIGYSPLALGLLSAPLKSTAFIA